MTSSMRLSANCLSVILCICLVLLNPRLLAEAACTRGCQCYRAGLSSDDYLVCRGRLTKFPRSISRTREVVIIQDNTIQVIPSNPFGSSSSSQIQYVHLDGNSIDTIADGAFSVPKNLRVVSLTDNKLPEIGSRIFEGANSLEELYVDDNYIAELKADVFRDMWRLKILSVSGNHIVNIETNTFNGLAELNELYLTRNRLAVLRPGMFTGLRDVKKIDLHDNALHSIIGTALGSLFQLEELILRENRLFEVKSQWFQDLVNLRTLDLSQNRINHIVNQAFASMTNLESLDLSNNRISVVGRAKFDGLGNLLTLNLANNFNLALRNGSFAKVLNLQSLDVRNVASSMSVGMLHHQGNTTMLLRVKKLMLSGLSSFPADLLYMVPNVESLIITDSNITTIPEGGFDNNIYLKEVNMSNCGISTIEEGVFHPLRKLRKLDISGNNLSQLPEDSLLQYHRNLVLCIHMNPWHCDCSISWITKWKQRRGGRWCPDSRPVCQSPPELEGQKLWEITYRNC